MKAKKFIRIVKALEEKTYIDVEEHPEKSRIEEDRSLAKAFRKAILVVEELEGKTDGE